MAISSKKHLNTERMILLIWARGAGNQQYPHDKDRLIGQVNLKFNNPDLTEEEMESRQII
jgi:hypothetical protein